MATPLYDYIPVGIILNEDGTISQVFDKIVIGFFNEDGSFEPMVSAE